MILELLIFSKEAFFIGPSGTKKKPLPVTLAPCFDLPPQVAGRAAKVAETAVRRRHSTQESSRKKILPLSIFTLIMKQKRHFLQCLTLRKPGGGHNVPPPKVFLICSLNGLR